MFANNASRAVCVSIVGLLGCHAQPTSGSAVAETVSSSPEAIPAAPLNGALCGTSYSVQNARYWIDRRLGYEKVEIKLSAGKASSPCAEPVPTDAPSVWLRHTGTTQVKAETIQIHQNDQGIWEVHYQIMQNAQWFGVGQSEALLVLREPTADRRLQGELSVCFADRTKSCVQGAFEADYCQRSIDAPVRGTQLMESPAAVERSNLEQSPDAGRDSEAKP